MKKEIKVNVFKIRVPEDTNELITLQEKLAGIADHAAKFSNPNVVGSAMYGSIDEGLQFRYIDGVTVNDKLLHHIAIFKEPTSQPVLFKRGQIGTVELDEEEHLGLISYALIDPLLGVILTITGGMAAPTAGAFQKFLRKITDSEEMRIVPFMEDDALAIVNAWTEYSKVTIKAVFPSKEEAESFSDYPACEYFGLVSGLAGKTIEITVADSQLDYSSVQRFISQQSKQVYLKKLEVTGKGNADAEPATIDICKKKLRHETEIEVVNIIQPGAAWTALFEAYRIFESKFEADCEFAEA